MILKNINNATTIIEAENFKLIFDPWIVGDLYQNSWSPFPKQKLDNNWFKNVTHLYISHIDSDHWDIETIKKINKKVKIIIPDIIFNKVIENKLNKLGYKNTEMIKIGVWKKFNENIKYYILPPLNDMAQEFSYYKKFKNFNSIAVDTGLILSDKKTNSNHLLLGDNSPYDLNLLNKHLQDIKLLTFWFPFNGYAQDYPLCYDNLTTKQKKTISLRISLNRENNLLKAIKILKPKYLIPHSSDFALNGPRRKEFFLVHNKDFIYKNLYSKRLENKSKIKTLALYSKDQINVSKTEVKIIKNTTSKEAFRLPKNIKLKFPKANRANISLEDDFQNSILAMRDRAVKYKIPMTGIKNWIFQLEIGKQNLYADLKDFRVYKINPNLKKHCIKLKTSKNIIQCIMQGKIHLNNATIGNYLSWERKPNKYNKFLWDMFNFFHLPYEKKKTC